VSEHPVRLIGPSDLPPGHPGRAVLTGWTPLIASQADPRFSYCAYVPRGAVPPSAVPAADAPLIVAVHSTGRDLHKTVAPWVETAEALGAIVVAPLFPAGIDDPNDLHNYKSIAYRGIRFDLVLLAMIDEAARRWRFDPRRFLLYGFSGGGQFAHRFAYLHPHRLKAAIIAAPGDITVLRDSRPWPAGTGDVDALFGLSINFAELRRLPLRVLVGDRDTDVATMRPGTSPDDTRLARAAALTQALARAGMAAELRVVPGAAHDAAPLAAAAATMAADLLAD
jgi:dienelactone hydrolase